MGHAASVTGIGCEWSGEVVMEEVGYRFFLLHLKKIIEYLSCFHMLKKKKNTKKLLFINDS